MSEVTDVVLPILRNIQADLTRLNAKVDNIAEAVIGNAAKLDDVNGYMTVALGHIARQDIDIADIRRGIKDLMNKAAAPGA